MMYRRFLCRCRVGLNYSNIILLDTDLLCEKLRLYGCSTKTCEWFTSFLTFRSQRVRIGQALSSPLPLVSGLPQGGILSPIVFTLYGADLEYWIKHSRAFNYADDTSTSNSGKEVEKVIEKLEEDANGVLDFMASNGLVANPSKTVFMLLNYRREESEEKKKIKVGEAMIEQEDHTKLLGMEIQETQKWNLHFKNLKSALNFRLYQIRRLAGQIPKDKLMSYVHSIWVSKLRYGLQLSATTRTTEQETRLCILKM